MPAPGHRKMQACHMNGGSISGCPLYFKLPMFTVRIKSRKSFFFITEHMLSMSCYKKLSLMAPAIQAAESNVDHAESNMPGCQTHCCSAELFGGTQLR